MTVEQQQFTQPQPAITITNPTDREVRFERVFNAPRDVVWNAFTDPSLVAQWWGGGTKVETMDVRVGGSWRFVAERPGQSYAFEGKYLEVDPPRRLVQTMVNGWLNGLTWTEHMDFDEIDGQRTRFTQTSVFDTTQVRDQVMETAEQGATYTFARLDQVLAKLTGEK